MSIGQWYFSNNEDVFKDSEGYDNKEDCITDGIEYYKENEDTDQRGFYVGKAYPLPNIEDAIGCDDIIDHITDFIDDNMSELQRDNFMPSKEQEQELTFKMKEVAKEWWEKHRFLEGSFMINNVEFIELNEDFTKKTNE